MSRWLPRRVYVVRTDVRADGIATRRCVVEVVAGRVERLGRREERAKLITRLQSVAHLNTLLHWQPSHSYYTYGDSDVIFSYHIYAIYFPRHDVGQSVRDVLYCDINFSVR